MKWRLVDRVVAFAPWEQISAAKALSFEETTLLERWGREGDVPPALLLESCVEAARWLVAVSSGFTRTAALSQCDRFEFGPVGPAVTLTVSVSVTSRSAERLEVRAECRAPGRREPVAQGQLALELLPLAGSFDREWVMALWGDLRRNAPPA
jgi:hypothetical protein